MRIGITIGVNTADEPLWINGIKQNAAFLCKILMASPRDHELCLVNTTDVELATEHSLHAVCKVLQFEKAFENIDVLIELGGQISPQQTADLKGRGVKIVSYCCGFEYVHAVQSIIFARRMWDNLFVNPDYDQVWIIPQVAQTTAPYLQSMRRLPVKIVPFVWDPIFLTQRSAQLPNSGLYKPVQGGRRFAVMEPNQDIVKFCLYPILAIEEYYRKKPNMVNVLHVTNAEHLAKRSTEFCSIMNHLDIVRDGKARFVGRFVTADFVAHMADVVVSHQWENPLNYFYFDVCWNGYPLIHNAALAKEMGYFYRDNDIQEAAKLISTVVDEHDARCEDYLFRQRAVIRQYTSTNRTLVAHYDSLLDTL